MKNYGYEAAQDTLRKAPLFLAGGVDWLNARAGRVRGADAMGVCLDRDPVFACVFGVVHFHQDRRFFRPMAPVFDAEGRLFTQADMGNFVRRNGD